MVKKARYKRKKYTGQPNKKKKDIVATLSKIDTINKITIGNIPYVHNNVDMFNIGYNTIKGVLNYNLKMYFSQYIDMAKYVGQKMKQQEFVVLARLGVKSTDELTQIFKFFSSVDNFDSPINQLIETLRLLKNSHVIVNDLNLKKDDKKIALKLFLDESLDRIKTNLNKITDSDNTLQKTKKLQKKLEETGTVSLDTCIGDAYEEIFALWLKEFSAFMTTDTGQEELYDAFGINEIIINYVEKIIDQTTNTTDIKTILNNIGEVNLSLKTGQLKYDYVDVFTDSRGYRLPKKYKPGITDPNTKYSINELKEHLNFDEVFGYLIYALANYKVLNLSSYIIQDTLSYLNYGLAWMHLIEGVYGTNFINDINNNNIGHYPMFIVTLNGVYSIADLLLYISNFQFTDIGRIITKPENNKNNRYLIQLRSAKSLMSNLKKEKSELIKTKKPRLGYPELHSELLKGNTLENIVNSITKDLTYQVKYRIQLSNVKTLLDLGSV